MQKSRGGSYRNGSSSRHIHLIPINTESDMDFRKPKLKLDSHKMENTAGSISSKIQL